MRLFTDCTYHLALKREMWKTEVKSSRENRPQFLNQLVFFCFFFFLEGEGGMVKKVNMLSYNVLIFCLQSACLERPGAEHGYPAASWPRDQIFFPCGSAGKESACRVGDLSSIPGLGRSPGEWKSYPLQYSSLENSMDYTVHGAAKSQTQLSDFHDKF